MSTKSKSIEAPDVETRRPVGHANYNGNAVPYIARIIGAGAPMGPNYMGESMWPVTAEFNPETNTSRVGFSLVRPTYIDLGSRS